MYETFDHTADLGLRIRASNLDELFSEAGRALFAVLVDDLETVESQQRIEIKIKSADQTYLLFDWLNELLYRFETEQLLFGQFKVAVEGNRLEGSAWGENLDRARHELMHEVKAITYHRLRVEQTPAGWQAEVIVDI